MEKKAVFLKPNHYHAYRREWCGDPMITGLFMVQPDRHHPQNMCYQVAFDDGFIDYVTLEDVRDGVYLLYVKGV